MGHIGRFDSVDGFRYARRTRVICCTSRGLEVGEVLSASESNGEQADGDLVRKLTVEDDLLLARLDKHGDDAFQACRQLIESRGFATALLDVEHLFDGQSLYFYFLGEVPAELERLTNDLAEAYEAKVNFQQFTETLTEGCGSGCETEDAENGCTSGACSSCAVAEACGPRGRR